MLTSKPAGPASLPVPLSSSGVNSSSKSGKGKKEVQVFQLEQHCKNLEDQLDEVGIYPFHKILAHLLISKVKFEIVKILTDKADFSKENAVLKNYQQVEPFLLFPHGFTLLLLLRHSVSCSCRMRS